MIELQSITARQWINLDGLAIIKTGESLQLHSYLDPVGIWTIGWGHTPSRKGQTISRVEAERLLISDTAHAAIAVDSVTHDITTTSNQFSAMVSLAFNIGVGAFRSSTVLKLHRLRAWERAADAFLRWNKGHVDGELVVLPGLTRRREQERSLYLQADQA